MALKQQKGKREKALLLPAPSALLAWYDRHRRIMPWRSLKGEQADPYRVWLSEIMLQQTTVATVGPYFQKFLQYFPTLKALAASPLDDVLRLWAGLGYYRRAKLLHQCTQVLWKEYQGVFPDNEKELLALPGIGPYTAAAIAAIAFDRPANVVDGNVERVMARIFDIREPLPKAKEKLRQAAASLVPRKRCGDYAQALMDLGATICTPRSPKCDLCPWQNNCRAFAAGIQETLPRRVKKTAKPLRRAIAFAAFNKKGEIFLRRRPSRGLLADMMEVPSSSWQQGEMPAFAESITEAPFKAKWHILPGVVTHVFTHFTLEMTVAVVKPAPGQKGIWVAPENAHQQALPSLMKKIIQHALKEL